MARVAQTSQIGRKSCFQHLVLPTAMLHEMSCSYDTSKDIRCILRCILMCNGKKTSNSKIKFEHLKFWGGQNETKI